PAAEPDGIDPDGPPPDEVPPPWMDADNTPLAVGAVAEPRDEPDAPRRALLRETVEGARWAERIAGLNLVGMTGELARQAQA
ncbi:hypothetical protein ACO1M0_14440, partial [Staphylococcus aureus]